MTFRHTLRHLSWLVVLGLGFLVVGCVIEDPQAIRDISKARGTLDDARKQGKADQFPGEFANLEKRFLEARGVYYACQDAKASELAKAIVADAGKLGAAVPRVAPANRPPVARCAAPAEGLLNQAVALDGSGSSDPDGDALTYRWDFGDNTNASFTFPRTTHQYGRPGTYSVRLTVDDGRGGSDTATCGPVQIKQQIVLRERGKALFDFNKATLKPAAISAVAPVVQAMRADPNLQAEIVGHTDSVGSDEYNLGLSRRRADAVRNYLVSQGIAANRIRTDGRGESEPEVPNTTAANRGQNRRVVITLQ